MQKQIVSLLVVTAASVAFNAEPVWTQSTPNSGTGQTEMKSKGERTGGTQETGQMERKKGEEEMEARGAQKPGRMGRSGAAGTGDKESAGERLATHDVRKAQEALKNKGHDPGSIDGVVGPQTRQAIRAFQNANGLKESGTLDAETAKKLGVEKGTASGASSTGSAGTAEGQPSPMRKPPSSPTSR